MDRLRCSWDCCQRNSDDILAHGLEQLRSARKYDDNHRLPSTAGNYVVSFDNIPLYIGEARNLTNRLKQQSHASTSTFYKNYIKKQNQLNIEQNLQIGDFDIQFIKAEIGRKELEEFGIVNLPTPLNNFQLGKRNLYENPLKDDTWDEVQSQYPEIIEEGGKIILATKPSNWLEATPFANSGLYVIHTC